MKDLLMLFLVGVFIIFGPLLIIWALDTLFPVLSIPYSLDTWAAVSILYPLFFVMKKKD